MRFIGNAPPAAWGGARRGCGRPRRPGHAPGGERRVADRQRHRAGRRRIGRAIAAGLRAGVPERRPVHRRRGRRTFGRCGGRRQDEEAGGGGAAHAHAGAHPRRDRRASPRAASPGRCSWALPPSTARRPSTTAATSSPARVSMRSSSTTSRRPGSASTRPTTRSSSCSRAGREVPGARGSKRAIADAILDEVGQLLS